MARPWPGEAGPSQPDWRPFAAVLTCGAGRRRTAPPRRRAPLERATFLLGRLPPPRQRCHAALPQSDHDLCPRLGATAGVRAEQGRYPLPTPPPPPLPGPAAKTHLTVCGGRRLAQAAQKGWRRRWGLARGCRGAAASRDVLAATPCDASRAPQRAGLGRATTTGHSGRGAGPGARRHRQTVGLNPNGHTGRPRVHPCRASESSRAAR